MPVEGMSPKRDEIIEFPENYQEMIKKLEERDKEREERAKAKHKAETDEQHQIAVQKQLKEQSHRASAEHKPLKDRTVIENPTSSDVIETRNKIAAEIGVRILGGEKPSTEPKELKGRVSQQPKITHDEDLD